MSSHDAVESALLRRGKFGARMFCGEVVLGRLLEHRSSAVCWLTMCRASASIARPIASLDRLPPLQRERIDLQQGADLSRCTTRRIDRPARSRDRAHRRIAPRAGSNAPCSSSRSRPSSSSQRRTRYSALQRPGHGRSGIAPPIQRTRAESRPGRKHSTRYGYRVHSIHRTVDPQWGSTPDGTVKAMSTIPIPHVGGGPDRTVRAGSELRGRHFLRPK